MHTVKFSQEFRGTTAAIAGETRRQAGVQIEVTYDRETMKQAVKDLLTAAERLARQIETTNPEREKR